ncbi:hypothetical protein E5676_scaffold208G001370 [Cucumis melo var. makuwa]|uniref:Ty3-gypsy retrotransposon protein n=1 Tax=Cucumis melo var. makuwa TaxID=1194695 RepID=A0A5D3E1B4_CUCMM|nr:hypothetical protein E5676_scaffold208G001370 [Cucumis melo var. makuwa]
MDSQVKSQIVNQPRVTTAGEGISDVKQKGVVGRLRQQGMMYVLGQQEAEETPDIITGRRDDGEVESVKCFTGVMCMLSLRARQVMRMSGRSGKRTTSLARTTWLCGECEERMGKAPCEVSTWLACLDHARTC